MRIIAKVMVLSLLLLAGCAAQTPPTKKPQLQPKPDAGPVVIDPLLAGRAREAANKVRGVEESTAVVIDKEISVAIKVTGWERFRLQSIRKEAHTQISKIAPAYEVHVTTDKKLFSELKKLEKEIATRSTDSSLPAIKKKIDKINKDMQG